MNTTLTSETPEIPESDQNPYIPPTPSIFLSETLGLKSPNSAVADIDPALTTYPDLSSNQLSFRAYLSSLSL